MTMIQLKSVGGIINIYNIYMYREMYRKKQTPEPERIMIENHTKREKNLFLFFVFLNLLLLFEIF